MRSSSRTSLLSNHMLQALSNENSNQQHTIIFKQVFTLLSFLSFPPTKLSPFSTFTSSLTKTSVSPSSRDQKPQTQIKLSSLDCSSIARSVLRSCSYLFDGEEKHGFDGSSIKTLLLGLSDVVPDISRRFRSFSGLKPEDVLDLLVGFEVQCREVGGGGGKVGTLWQIFRWAGRQYKGFEHLHRSCEIMVSMLVREGMVKEAELLLMEMESEGILLDNHEIFCDLIEKYVIDGDIERAVLLFDWMRGRGLVPSLSCYHSLVDHLVKMRKTELAYRVCLDWVATGTKSNNMEICGTDGVVELLCLDGRIQEARYLLRKLASSGFEPSSSVVNKIACGYCEKQDFEDLLSFFAEMKRAPDVLVGNKIIHVICRKFGIERADFFRQELEGLGLRPDELTFGILIGWSCREGAMRSGFFYLSEILSRGLKPDISSYNAIIGGLFRRGMWKHARLILDEMVDSGITPDVSTFKVLLAGYCKARQFGEVKMMVDEMVRYGLAENSLLDNPLSKVFIMLGFDPLAVRLKRDDDAGLSKTEFFDDLGNGLYLDTDLDEYEERVNEVLDGSMIPDFNLLITRECESGSLRIALELVDTMVRWGQELSCYVFSALLKALCTSRSQIKASASLLERWPNLANQLDGKTLNFLIQKYCKKGLTNQARLIFHRMGQMHLPVYNETYTALIKGLGKKRAIKDLRSSWAIARNDNWLPELDQCEALWECLCRKGMLKEASELFESMLVSCPHFWSEICNMFVEKLCVTGFSGIAHTLVVKLQEKGFDLEQRVYSHLMKGFSNEKKSSVAFNILDIMLAHNSAPCLDDSLMLIPQLCKANLFEKAITLGKFCLEKQSTDSVSVYRALIEGFCLMGKIAEAEKQFQDMLSEGYLPDDNIYNLLCQGHCRAKNLRKVGEVLSIMIRKSIGLSMESYRNCIGIMCMEGRFSQTLSLKEFMLRENDRCSLIINNILIFYLFSAKNHLLVSRVLDEMEKKGLLLDEIGYNFLVHGFSVCKDLPSSMQCLSSMISKGFKPNKRSLRIVISSLCDLGELRKAFDLSREMELRGWIHGSVIQTKIVEGLLSNGKTQEAERFLARLVEKGLIPDNINYDNLIKQFCHLGRTEKAVGLLNIMLKKGNIPDASSYDSIILGLSTRGNLDKAMDFHTEMLDRGLSPSIDSWKMLIFRHCEKGETADAEKLVRSMAELGETPTREMYTSIIDRYRAEKNVAKASEVVGLMQQSGYEPDFETHWSLISNLSSSSEKHRNSSQGFLSRLLSGSGFAWKQD